MPLVYWGKPTPPLPPKIKANEIPIDFSDRKAYNVNMTFYRNWVLPLAALGILPAWASGFGLYEASAKTYALGGAAIGRAVDASANFYNPATLTDFTNTVVTTGVMTEHPRARMKVRDGKAEAMDPGCFCLPAFHLVQPLPWDFAFGLGVMPEYGLGSAYGHHWSLANNTTDTTVMSATVNPNLAYQITDDWSIGAGLRFLYFDFDQHSRPVVGADPRSGYVYRFRNHLQGDNDMEDFGWQIGTKYDLTEHLSVGLVYKSETKVDVEGTTRNRAYDVPMADAAHASSGFAKTELDLPQSITGGFNWDIVDTVHLGGSVAWTQWSSVDVLDFNLNGNHKPIKLRWKDTWRVGIGPSWDFADHWTLMSSYVYETDCSSAQDSTMLPAADRHMISLGLAWNVRTNLEICVVYGMILMGGRSTQATGPDGTLWEYTAHRALSHAAGVSLTYHF